MSEVRGQRSEGQETEGEETEVRGQRSEVGKRQKSDV